MTDREIPGSVSRRRLILGFDAGCMSCADLAESIEEAVGTKLETMSLRDPEVTEWRHRALGENAPWAPTLIEVGNGQVRAWTGVTMGARLSRRLGPTATWKILKTLGEFRGSNKAKHSATSGLTRSQFLKGVGGAAFGLTVLSGTGGLAATAMAGEEEHWLSQLSIASSKELSKKQAAVAWARMARGRHLRRLLSSRIMEEKSAVGGIRSRMLSARKTGVEVSSTTTIKGVRHQLKGGGQLLALAYQEEDTLILSYRLDKPGKRTRQSSQVIEDESVEFASVLAEAEDGTVFGAPEDETSGDENNIVARRRRCRRRCYRLTCTRHKKRCMFNCCGPCSLACLGGFGTCLACVGVWCPVCRGINRCCARRGCRYACYA